MTLKVQRKTWGTPRLSRPGAVSDVPVPLTKRKNWYVPRGSDVSDVLLRGWNRGNGHPTLSTFLGVVSQLPFFEDHVAHCVSVCCKQDELSLNVLYGTLLGVSLSRGPGSLRRTSARVSCSDLDVGPTQNPKSPTWKTKEWEVQVGGWTGSGYRYEEEDYRRGRGERRDVSSPDNSRTT